MTPTPRPPGCPSRCRPTSSAEPSWPPGPTTCTCPTTARASPARSNTTSSGPTPASGTSSPIRIWSTPPCRSTSPAASRPPSSPQAMPTRWRRTRSPWPPVCKRPGCRRRPCSIPATTTRPWATSTSLTWPHPRRRKLWTACSTSSPSTPPRHDDGGAPLVLRRFRTSWVLEVGAGATAAPRAVRARKSRAGCRGALGAGVRGRTGATAAPGSGGLWFHLPCDEFQVVQIVQVQHLQVQPLRAQLAHLTHLLRRFGHGAGHAVAPQFLRVPPDRLGTATELGLIPAHAHHQRQGVHQLLGIAAGILTGRPHPREPRLGLGQWHEAHVVLGGELRRQGRRALLPAPAHDHRQRLLYRLGQGGGVLQLVVHAVERKRLAHGRVPQPGEHRELLLEHAE